jgi:hypothetical protein
MLQALLCLREEAFSSANILLNIKIFKYLGEGIYLKTNDTHINSGLLLLVHSLVYGASP